MQKLIVSVLIILFLISCNSTKYIEREVPITTTKTEYIYNIKYDSIYIHDSIFIYIKGDTVFKEKIKTLYKSIIQRDTINKIDSIPYVVRSTEYKIQTVNKLTWYQKILNWIGGICLIFLIVYIIFKKYV